MNNENEFLDWTGSFIAEESNFTLLPAGEYPFVVTGMERKIYDGPSEKIPNGAPYAEIEFEITAPEGTTTVKERIYLMKKWAWKLTQFFSSIGQSPIVGQPFSPNWQTVIGSRGKAKLSVNSYQKNGETKQNNRIEEFLASAVNVGGMNQGYVPPASPQPNYTQAPTQMPNQAVNPAQMPTQQQPNYTQTPPQQPQNGGFQTGAF
ncbi:hypothetical protein [Enterococcus sp.]|uniref:hypothetical protein n=1 Tax=Enterococcus sp. TaxID=35783 RepID=UPI003C7811E6